MNLNNVKIDENIFKRLNPFKKKDEGENINFDKMKEISELRKNLQNHLKTYVNKFQHNPERKQEFFDELGEDLLNDLSITIGRIQQVLTQHNDNPKKLNEEIKDNSIIRNINTLFNELLKINSNTPIVQVEEILIHIYKKLKEHLDIKFPMDAEESNIDIDAEHTAYVDYENKFFKNPSTNFEDFANIDVGTTSDDVYNQVKQTYKNAFDKEWENKYKKEVLNNDENYAVIEVINKAWAEKPLSDKTSYQDFKKDRMYNTYFELWFNTLLKSKFNKLWDRNFKKIWIDIHNKERANTKSRLSHLKENFQDVFKG